MSIQLGQSTSDAFGIDVAGHAGSCLADGFEN
jgi:hypothetical protein